MSGLVQCQDPLLWVRACFSLQATHQIAPLNLDMSSMMQGLASARRRVFSQYPPCELSAPAKVPDRAG